MWHTVAAALAAAQPRPVGSRTALPMAATLARRFARVAAALAVAASAGSAQVTVGAAEGSRTGCMPPGCAARGTTLDHPLFAASAFAAPTIGSLTFHHGQVATFDRTILGADHRALPEVVGGTVGPATTFTSTPEPATLALIALGVLSMAGAERTRRRARS